MTPLSPPVRGHGGDFSQAAIISFQWGLIEETDLCFSSHIYHIALFFPLTEDHLAYGKKEKKKKSLNY